MKPKKNNRDHAYNEKVSMLKYMLESMVAMEEYFHYVADTKRLRILNMQWITDVAEIEINDYIPEKDLFYITVYVFPAKTEDDFPIEYIHYFYRVIGNDVKRELVVTPEAVPFYSEGKKVLEELMFILSSSIEMDVVMENNSI